MSLKRTMNEQTTGYYSALKKNLATDTRNNMEELGGIALSKRSQTQKSTYSVIPFTRCATVENIRIEFASVSVDTDREDARGNFLGVMVMFYILTGVWVVQVNAFVKTQLMYI